jgi:FixJ family two-component response regulator
LAQGAVEFIETPADPKVLLDTIESAIARSPSRHRQAG